MTTPASLPSSPTIGSPLPVRLQVTPIIQLQVPAWDDESTLLHHRYLSRGGGLLLIGPTGIGKSSLSMQFMLNWALGDPVFGIAPREPLTSVLIQAENDEGDLAEMRDGVIRGCSFNQQRAEKAMSRVFVVNESVRTGLRFFEQVVGPVLEAHRPDLLWIDPALAYIGGETTSQADVGAFLRNGLQPLLREFKCGGIIIHHTNKPPTQKNRKRPSPMDLAYSGSGSAEWANWARAVLVIEPTDVRNVYNLHASKRGTHLKWQDDQDNRVLRKTIAHSLKPDEIFWRSATEHEESLLDLPLAASRADDVLGLIPTSGVIEKKDLERKTQKELGMASRAAKEAINGLIKTERAFLWYRARPAGGRHIVFVGRTPQPEDDKPQSKS